jgi:hypothetical protein
MTKGAQLGIIAIARSLTGDADDSTYAHLLALSAERVAQRLGLPRGQGTVQQQVLGPGEQVDPGGTGRARRCDEFAASFLLSAQAERSLAITWAGLLMAWAGVAGQRRTSSCLALALTPHLCYPVLVEDFTLDPDRRLAIAGPDHDAFPPLALSFSFLFGTFTLSELWVGEPAPPER